MSKLNVDLMLAVREQITSHPETHYQGDWARRTECGTTLCIAGWACVLSGQELRWYDTEDEQGRFVARADYASLGEPIWSKANELLGLSDQEGGHLFYAMDGAMALAKLDELIEKGKNES